MSNTLEGVIGFIHLMDGMSPLQTVFHRNPDRGVDIL